MKRILALLLTLMLTLTCLPVLADTPTPISKIPYEELPENRDGIYHYLLLCMDQWSGGLKDNNDGIILLTFDTRAGRIMLTSFMRDSLVERPDGVIGRINYIVKNYGPDELCKIISTHLGVKVEKYVIFNFQQIANIVDYMGGVELYIEDSDEAAYLKRNLFKNMTTPDITLRSAEIPGTFTFNGRSAVVYMRMRKGNTGGDFSRNKRVRTVLSVLADKCRVMTYDQAKDLLDSIVENSTTTNMSGDDLIKALDQAFSLRSCTIEELALPQPDSRKGINYAGMSVQDINWEMCREDMEEYLESGWLVIEEETEDGEELDDKDFFLP